MNKFDFWLGDAPTFNIASTGDFSRWRGDAPVLQLADAGGDTPGAPSGRRRVLMVFY